MVSDVKFSDGLCVDSFYRIEFLGKSRLPVKGDKVPFWGSVVFLMKAKNSNELQMDIDKVISEFEIKFFD